LPSQVLGHPHPLPDHGEQRPALRHERRLASNPVVEALPDDPRLGGVFEDDLLGAGRVVTQVARDVLLEAPDGDREGTTAIEAARSERPKRRTESAIHLASMPDLHDEDHLRDVVHGIDDPVVALPRSIAVGMAGQFLATWRPRLGTQRLDTGDDTPSLLLSRNPLEFFRSRPFDPDAISCHAASGP
jgi:hypothetical protein